MLDASHGDADHGGVVSRVHLTQGAVHDRLRVFSRGGLAGVLCVTAGDGVRVMSRLTRDWHRVVDTYRAHAAIFLDAHKLAHDLQRKLERLDEIGDDLDDADVSEINDAVCNIVRRLAEGYKSASRAAVTTERL